MADETLAYQLDAGSSDEVKLWLGNLHEALEKQPARELFDKFSRDTTVHVVNQASSFVQRAFCWRRNSSSVDNFEFHKAKCSIYLYYRVLQGVLDTSDDSNFIQWLATKVDFQEALLNCAVELVTFAYHADTAPFPAATMQLQRLHRCLDLWEASAHFRAHLGPLSPQPMPAAALHYLALMRARIVEELAFLPGNSLYDSMVHGGGGSCSEGDLTLVSEFICVGADMAAQRCAEVCHHLAAGHTVLQARPDFTERAQALMDHVQRSHLDLLFEQHQLNLVVCCVYAVLRVMNISVPFKRVTEAVLSAFPTTSPKIFAEAVIKTSTKTEDGNCVFSDVREFYNKCFLPAVQTDFLSIEPKVEPLHSAVCDSSTSGKAAPQDAGMDEENVNSRRSTRSGAKKILRLPLQSLTAADMNTRSPLTAQCPLGRLPEENSGESFKTS